MRHPLVSILVVTALHLALVTPTKGQTAWPWAAKYLLLEKAAYRQGLLQNTTTDPNNPLEWYANKGIGLLDIVYDEGDPAPKYFYHLDMGGSLRAVMLDGKFTGPEAEPIDTVVAWAWARQETLVTAIQWSRVIYTRTMGPAGVVNVTMRAIPREYRWHGIGSACALTNEDGSATLVGVVAKRTDLYLAQWDLTTGDFAIRGALTDDSLAQLLCVRGDLVVVDRARNRRLGFEAHLSQKDTSLQLESKQWTGTFDLTCACSDMVVMLDRKFRQVHLYQPGRTRPNRCLASSAPMEVVNRPGSCACAGDSIQWVDVDGQMVNMSYTVEGESAEIKVAFAVEPFNPTKIAQAITLAKYGSLYDELTTPSDAPTDTTENVAGTAVATAVLLLAVVGLTVFLFWLHYRTTPFHYIGRRDENGLYEDVDETEKSWDGEEEQDALASARAPSYANPNIE